MRLALTQARLAYAAGEVPVGAVLADGQGALLAACHNRTIANCDPTAHAEMLALRQAAQKIGNYRLLNCTLYVTLEPCAMCAGALIWARLAQVVFAAFDGKAGALGSTISLHQQPGFNHQLQVNGGLLADESVALLQSFFGARRRK